MVPSVALAKEARSVLRFRATDVRPPTVFTQAISRFPVVPALTTQDSMFYAYILQSVAHPTELYRGYVHHLIHGFVRATALPDRSGEARWHPPPRWCPPDQ